MDDALRLIPCVIVGETEPDDWTVVYRQHDVGRIYRSRGPDNAERWQWGMCSGQPSFPSGRAKTLPEAKEAFRREWDHLSDESRLKARGRPVRNDPE